VAFSFGDDLLAPGAGQPEADELVLELPVLAALDGLVEEVRFGGGGLLESGVEGGGRDGLRDRGTERGGEGKRGTERLRDWGRGRGGRAPSAGPCAADRPRPHLHGPADLDLPQPWTDNGLMVIRGRVQNGVIVLEDQVSLPEGAEVAVELCAAPEARGERMSEEQRQRLREVLQDFESLPNENPGDTFSGADHDRVLYGDG